MKNWKLQFEEGLSKDDKETILRIIGVKGCIEENGYLYPDDYNSRPHDYTKMFTIPKELTKARTYIESCKVVNSKKEIQQNKVNKKRKKEIKKWIEDRRECFVLNKLNYSISWDYNYNDPRITSNTEIQTSKYLLSKDDCEEAITLFGQDLKLLFV
jgi:hypothetical protein